MSDILQEAKELLEYFNNDKSYTREIAFIETAVAEIKHLREERYAILGVKTKEGLTASEWVLRTGLAERQLAAKDIELTRWQQIAIDERANQIAGIPVSHIKDRYKRNAYREQAAKELDDDLTIAYMLGSQKANERLKVLQGYVGRLEKEFLDLKTNSCFVAHANGISEEEIVAYKQKIAQDALDKIREGT